MSKHNKEYDVMELGNEEFLMVPMTKMMYMDSMNKMDMENSPKMNMEEEEELSMQEVPWSYPKDHMNMMNSMNMMNPFMLCCNPYLMMNMMNYQCQCMQKKGRDACMDAFEDMDSLDCMEEETSKHTRKEGSCQREKNNKKANHHKEECCKNSPEKIARKIEMYNPGIIRTMVNYGMPLYVARNLLLRIVKLSLMYGEF